jgi:Pyridine nucleotide-disulphide oxidoreductase
MIVLGGGPIGCELSQAMSRLGVKVTIIEVLEQILPKEDGAQHAHGSVLLFLHADTVLPTSALEQMESVLTNDGIVGGGFARRYDSDSWFLRTTCLLASLRTRLTGWFLGDQAIFVRKQVFESLGGSAIWTCLKT